MTSASQRELDRNMKNCNKFIIMNCHYIIDDRKAFENNNTQIIKQELRNVMNKIDIIVNKRYININDLKNDVYDKNNPMIDMIKDFFSSSQHIRTTKFVNKVTENMPKLFEIIYV